MAPTNPTSAEWQTYHGTVDALYQQVNPITVTADPASQIEAAPAVFTANPTNSTGQLNAAKQVTAWLHWLQAQSGAAAIPSPVIGAPPPPPPGPSTNQLLQMIIQMQQQQMNIQASAIQIETPLPTKFTGNPADARTFLAECENYFVLNPMNPDQRVRFTLQLIGGDENHWKSTAMRALAAASPPDWSQNWDLFKKFFNLRFQDRQERARAVHQLLNGQIIQITSVCEFVDQVVDTCQKAGWNDEAIWRDVVRNGLKKDVTMAMAGRFPAEWNDFVIAIIDTDEDLQWNRERERPAKKTTTTSSLTSTSKTQRPDKSKYKLTEEERKEHIEQQLCFKCHKPECSSKTCKNPRTVYKDIRKMAKVANIQNKKEEPLRG